MVKLTTILPMSDNQQKGHELKHHLLRRLAHIVVGNETDLAKTAIEFFVEQVLLEKGNKESCKEIESGMKEIFLLKFSRDEIREATNKLVETGKVIGFNNNQQFSLEARRADAIRKKNSELKDFETALFQEWLSLISVRYPDLIEEDKKILVADLQLYLSKIFLKSGAECAALIYSADKELDVFIKKYVDDRLNQILPARNARLTKVRSVEFPLFLREADNGKKIYFASLLDGTFVYNIIQIDPETSKLLKENFRNYKIYLDTNVLYSLFELHNERNTAAIEKVLDTAKEFGITFAVSRKTVEEMSASIIAQREYLLVSPFVKRELAEIGADISDEENFITAYWRAFHKTGISKEDFIEKFTHIAELLKQKSIPVEDTPNFSSKVLDAEKTLLNESILAHKKDEIAEHDSYHRLMVRHNREEAVKTGSHQQYYFLTIDSQLIIYDIKTRELGESPFALLPHQLLQVLRPFIKRTEDYDATFIELFSKPQIKYTQGVLPTDLAQKIIAKISAFKDFPPEIAFGIIADQAFREGILKNQGDDIKVNEIIEKVVEEKTIAELNKTKEKNILLESEKQKGERLNAAQSEREKATNAKLKIYKNLSLGLAVLLFTLVNAFVIYFYWAEIPKIWRGSFSLVDILLLYGVSRIKWKVGVAWTIVLGIVGIIAFFFQIIDR